MKNTALLVLVVAFLALAQQSEPPRDSVDFVLGGGAWLPGLMNDDSQLSVGYGFIAGIETPMFQEDMFRLTAGPAFCGSDRDNYDGLTAIMLNLGYRKFPFYKPYAGPRALEPFIGVTGGGIIVWDRIAESFPEGESKSTGGAMLGIEIGTRIRMNESTSLDIALAGEWVPVGSALAGEQDEDLSGIRIQCSLVL